MPLDADDLDGMPRVAVCLRCVSRVACAAECPSLAAARPRPHLPSRAGRTAPRTRVRPVAYDRPGTTPTPLARLRYTVPPWPPLPRAGRLQLRG